jgi:NADH-quinone oxidoreductase subunit E
MAWEAIDRTQPITEAGAEPLLTESVREKIRGFFPRYETKRAALLPALHIVQDTLGHVPLPAMREVAELLEIAPADVYDVLSFYSAFWEHPKARKVIMLCRSISCQLMGADAVAERIKAKLGVDEHGTTADARYSFVTEECLAGCDYAPCMLVNEKLHKRVSPDDVDGILDDPNNDRLDIERSDLFDGVK